MTVLTWNKYVKFGLKNPNRFGRKMSENLGKIF